MNRCKDLFKRKKYFGVSCTLNSTRPRKMPGWIVPVLENFSVNKRVCRKQTIEIVLRGFCFFFKFCIWLSRLLSQNLENNSIEIYVIFELACRRKFSGEQ